MLGMVFNELKMKCTCYFTVTCMTYMIMGKDSSCIKTTRNTFANYNKHVQVCFLFNNTDSHISRLTANFVFQAFEGRKKHNNKTYHSIFSVFP